MADRTDGLRVVATVMVIAAAAASIVLMLRAAHPPFFLRAMFFVWVLSPFVALTVAGMHFERWTATMIVVAFGSVAFYTRFLPMPRSSRPAAVFLLVPLASWLLIAGTALLIRVSRKPTGVS